ncbi:glycosyltransferase [Pontibacter liquoris]|uniref:glycosyltransferase n=1 Tax=Pontibacter liquoris TaxID=2905677 RepID=UPI001FA7373D|nr:glycosyltransferase [Pontibacter liquoris]
MQPEHQTSYKYVIVSPCFNENSTVIAFLNSLDQTLKSSPHQFLVVVVDDGSTDNTLALLQQYRFTTPYIALKVLPLRFNVGHQKAIYQGLLYARRFQAGRYIVMDADGEDDPRALLELTTIQDADIVFVTRGKRQESLGFKLGYFFYRVLFALVANSKVNFGNYSMISHRALEAVLGQSFVHYSAFLSRLRLSRRDIKYNRLRRLDGQSKMNFQSLVMHGLKSLIEYSDKVLLFFIKFFIVVLLGLLGVAGFILYVKLFTDNAVLGWASTLGTSLFNASLIILGIIVLGLLLLNINDKSKPHEAIFTD